MMTSTEVVSQSIGMGFTAINTKRLTAVTTISTPVTTLPQIGSPVLILIPVPKSKPSHSDFLKPAKPRLPLRVRDIQRHSRPPGEVHHRIPQTGPLPEPLE